jgi:hypothetical protein
MKLGLFFVAAAALSLVALTALALSAPGGRAVARAQTDSATPVGFYPPADSAWVVLARTSR